MERRDATSTRIRGSYVGERLKWSRKYTTTDLNIQATVVKRGDATYASFEQAEAGNDERDVIFVLAISIFHINIPTNNCKKMSWGQMSSMGREQIGRAHV